MKRLTMFLTAALLSAVCLFAKDYVKDEVRSGKADNIIGRYLIVDAEGTSKAVIYKHTDGTYRCRTAEGNPIYEKDGSLMLDKLNPNPELRNIPIHEAIIIQDLKYIPSKKQWEGRIHNPFNKLEKADCTVDFVEGGKTLRVRGHIGPIGASRYWKVIE